MTWTPPRTWATGEILTAALFNLHIRDNLMETETAKAIAAGDLFAAAGPNSIVRVPVTTNASGGASGGVLIAHSGCYAGMAYACDAGSPIRATVGALAFGDSPCAVSQAAVVFYFSSATNWAGMGRYTNGGVWYRGENHFLYTRDGAAATCPAAVAVIGTSSVHIGVSASTANANMTRGLTVSSRAGRNLLQFRALNEDHGAWAVLDRTCMAALGLSAAAGAQWLAHASEFGRYRNAADNSVLKMTGYAGAPDTARATTAHGFFRLDAYEISGTTGSALKANGNLLAVQGYSTIVALFDADGDLHLDAGTSASAYDGFDDVALVRALEVERGAAGLVRERWDEFLRYGRRELETAKIATFNDGPGGDGSVFVNYAALARLHSGAIWQLGQTCAALEQELMALEAEAEALAPLLLERGA